MIRLDVIDCDGVVHECWTRFSVRHLLMGTLIYELQLDYDAVYFNNWDPLEMDYRPYVLFPSQEKYIEFVLKWG